jgi:hypothetical protein
MALLHQLAQPLLQAPRCLRSLRQAAWERLTLGGSGDGRDNKGRRKSCNYKMRI